jgi:hypothetical protein
MILASSVAYAQPIETKQKEEAPAVFETMTKAHPCDGVVPLGSTYQRVYER